MHSVKFGQGLPDTRISNHVAHIGIAIRDRAAADRFYQDILGFTEMWHGGQTDDATDWVEMRVPDGSDWLAYELNVQDRAPKAMAAVNHFGLAVDSAAAAYRRLTGQAQPVEALKIGPDGRRQLNLFDPNGTRVELIELKPVQTR